MHLPEIVAFIFFLFSLSVISAWLAVRVENVMQKRYRHNFASVFRAAVGFLSSSKRLFALFLITAAIYVCYLMGGTVLAVFMLGGAPEYFFEEKAVALKNSLPVPSNPIPISTAPLQKELPNTKVTLTVGKLEPLNRKMIATVKVFFPDEVKRSLTDGRTGSPIAVEDGSGATGGSGLRLSENYKDYEIMLRFHERMGNPSVIVRIPVAEVFRKDRLRKESGTSFDYEAQVELPAISRPHLFPNDYYWITSYVEIILPAPVAARHGKNGFFFMLPTEVGIIPSPDINDKNFILVRTDGPESPALELLIMRGEREKQFVYLIVFLPMLILVVLVHILFLSDYIKKESESPLNLVLGILAAIFAVLPLRQVIVPPEVTGILTRVDYILGLYVVLLVGLLLFRYATLLLKSK